MAIEEGWGDDLFPPAETMPGPGNPWAAKSGGGRPSGGGVGKPQPDFTPPRPDEGGFGDVVVDGDAMVGGHVMQALGVLSIFAGGLALGIAIGASNPAGWLVIGAILVVVGAALLLAGVGAEIGGIDPPVIAWRDRVTPAPARQWRAPVWMTTAEAALVRAAYEFERLCHGQMDLIDRARQAASEKDAKVYEMHLRDLYTVQHRMEANARRVADGLEQMVADRADVLKQDKLPASASLRDVSMALPAERQELARLGVGSGDLLMAMAQMRGVNPRQRAFQAFADARLKAAGGDMNRLLQGLAADLRDRGFVDARAFKP